MIGPYGPAGSHPCCSLEPPLVLFSDTYTTVARTLSFAAPSFIHSFIHYCNKYLLSSFCVPNSSLLQGLHTNFPFCQNTLPFPLSLVNFYSSLAPFSGKLRPVTHHFPKVSRSPVVHSHRMCSVYTFLPRVI